MLLSWDLPFLLNMYWSEIYITDHLSSILIMKHIDQLKGSNHPELILRSSHLSIHFSRLIFTFSAGLHIRKIWRNLQSLFLHFAKNCVCTLPTYETMISTTPKNPVRAPLKVAVVLMQMLQTWTSVCAKFMLSSSSARKLKPIDKNSVVKSQLLVLALETKKMQVNWPLCFQLRQRSPL